MTISPFMKLDRNNNLKAMDFSAWGGLEGFLRDTSNGSGGYAVTNLLKRISPFLSRAVDMTSAAVAELPFDIISTTETEDVMGTEEKAIGKGKKKPEIRPKVIDSSADWQNIVMGMDSPKRFLSQIASSLCGGKAYVIPEFADEAQQKLIDLHYVAPHTVLPMITVNGLQWFSRASDYGNAGIYYPIVAAPGDPHDKPKSLSEAEIALCVKAFNNSELKDESYVVAIQEAQKKGKFLGPMMYFWLPDSDIEIGPAKKYPLGTALISAQMLASMDNSVKLLADRNFVPATLVSAKGMPSPKDREITENWLNRFMRGAFETFAKIINSEAISMVKLGAGMEDMKGAYSEIKKQGIEEIGAAFGIPAGIFLSDKAYSQEMDALIRLWYSASEFIAIYRCIEDTMNTQLLNRWGWKMVFKPETIDAFQEDEATRATGFRDLVSARLRPSIAAQILGMEMPDGVDYEDLDEEFDKPEPVLPVAPQKDPGQPSEASAAAPTKPAEKKPVSLNADEQKDLALWRQMAQRFYRKGKGTAVDFECKALPEELAAPIRAKLATAQNELDIVKAFEIVTDAEPASLLQGHLAIAQALNKLAEKV